MQREGRYDPLVFARAFIDHQGMQIPGEPDDETGARELADLLMRSLAAAEPLGNDATLRREFQRACSEAAWVQAAESERLVGFRFQPGPLAAQNPVCRMFVDQDRGLGAMVFPKGEIVVLPPECDGSTFVPVYEHDVEE